MTYNSTNGATATPLWLKLRTEYIDDNFDDLVKYLRQSQTMDDFYKSTLQLLEERTVKLIEEIGGRKLYADKNDHSSLVKDAKLLVLYLLTSTAQSKHIVEAYVSLMETLSELHPKRSGALIRNAVDALRHKAISSFGFSWSDYDTIGQEILAVKICSAARFETPRDNILVYSGNGTVIVDSMGMTISSLPSGKSSELLSAGSRSLDSHLGIDAMTSSGDRLKQSHESDIFVINEFVKNFTQLQRLKMDIAASSAHRHYDIGAEARIRVVDKRNRTIYVETVDTDFKPIKGTIRFGNTYDNVLYFNYKDIYDFIQPGDELIATVVDAERGTFNFESQFKDFCINDCLTNIGHDETQAKCLVVNPNSMVWITEDGFTVVSRLDKRFAKGDRALLELVKYYDKSDKGYGKIESQIIDEPDPADQDFNILDAQRDCFRAYIDSMKREEKAVTAIGALSVVVPLLFVRQLFVYQQSLLKPSERYRILALSLLLAVSTGDESAEHYLLFVMKYLRTLVKFVDGKDISDTTLDAETEFAEARSTQLRQRVVGLLKEYGRHGKSEVLDNAIDSDDEQLSKLAQLILSSNHMQGLLSKSALGAIKHEIFKTLSIASEYDTDLEADSGIFVGVESSTIEFKTSVVFPPNKGNITNQGLNVMKGVCAFLNSKTGGNLYIGVNDSGYVSGIENDMERLGHSELDTYIRYIQDKLIKYYLGLDAATYVKIERMYDDRVVVLHVEPHPFRVVELEQIAYTRVNNESCVMPEQMRLELMSQKRSHKKGEAANVSRLYEACNIRRQVVLERYSSSSGEVSNRHVEPYDVRPDDSLVMCYDLDKKDCRIFSIKRIGSVVVTDKPWQNESLFQRDVEVDAFHMTGTKSIGVTLQLDAMARNLLLEEFPRTKDHIRLISQDKWELSIRVFDLRGVGRFYMGLADHIKIVDTPELKQYVKEFVDNNLTDLG